MDPGTIMRCVEVCATCIAFIVETCQTYRAADEEVAERIAIVENCWTRTRLQVEFVQPLTSVIDAEHRRVLDSVLSILATKLSAAITSLEGILARQKRSGSGIELRPGFLGFSRGVRKGKYSLVKGVLDEVIDDLEKWQRRFDPSWFLIMRMANPVIDQQLNQAITRQQSRPHQLLPAPSSTPSPAPPAYSPPSPSPSSARAVSSSPQPRPQHRQRPPAFSLAAQHTQASPLTLANDMRTALYHNDVHQSVFLPTVPFELVSIPYSSAKAARRRGSSNSGWFIVDTIARSPGADIQAMTNDVRELARKLSRVDPLTFGLLNCKGVIRITDRRQPNYILSFNLILRIPEGMEIPQSLRQMLLLYPKESSVSITRRVRIAQELARSISYVHNFKFVHKNISPESVLILEDLQSSRSATFLVGFDRFRSAEGGTLLQGDRLWDRNIYRHPARQGNAPEDVYQMQHDIYSLGVCLLEIGLWDSFVVYDADVPAPGGPFRDFNSKGLEGADPNGAAVGWRNGSLVSSVQTKENMEKLARERLPQTMGERYSRIVLSCLTCLDENNEEFGSEELNAAQDPDGIHLGVLYNEVVLGRLCEIVV